MDTIEILGGQEETLETAEDLREEISVEVVQPEVMGSQVKIEFETSQGLCTGYYFVNDLTHQELSMEPDSILILTSLYPEYTGAYLKTSNRDWVEIDLSEKYKGCPEYKIYNRIMVL